MPNEFVGRQPIFNRRLEVVGYELLVRGGCVTEALVASSDVAKASVTLSSLSEIPLEQIVGAKTAWVSVTRELATRGPAPAVAPGLVGIGILDDAPIDGAVLAGLRELKGHGYALALDNFCYRPEAAPLLALVDVVRLDMAAFGRERLDEQVACLRPYRVAVLAAGVDTRADRDRCADAGCDLLQGFFFCEPLVRDGAISADRLALLGLVAALHDPAVELSDVERLLARDPALGRRLLRYVNSAFIWPSGEVRSIGQALALLGVENLRPWAILSVIASIAGKPAELTVTALSRARFCQQAGETFDIYAPGELFTLGLFSVIDALMDAPMPDVLASLPLADDMCDALICRRGSKGLLLDCATALETGELDRAEATVSGAGELYFDSLVWANRAAISLFGSPS